MIGDKIKGVGEIVLRVHNMEVMKNFYQHTLGLRLFDDKTKDFTFFKIAEGYGGHTQILALFSESNLNAFDKKLQKINAEKSSLHHFALVIDYLDYNYVLDKIKAKRLEYKEHFFEWVNWKSIFIKDPEENTIEFVCFDNKIL